MLLQSYDFLHQFDHYGCTMQTGGSDQWGNITAGVELIRRMRGKQAYALVYPLVTKADGTKFGKTETGTVWLSAERTSPYRFYQFWLNTDDRDVISYLKIFTWLAQEQIQELEDAFTRRPEERQAQRLLAREMTSMVHGETALAKAERASQALFGGDITGLSGSEITEIFSEVPSTALEKGQLVGGGIPVVDLLVATGVAKSRGDARRSIEEGGISINNARVGDISRLITLAEAVDGRFLLLRKGRKNYHLVKVVG
jgi:tyrosyl-tRNA synthetase